MTSRGRAAALGALAAALTLTACSVGGHTTTTGFTSQAVTLHPHDRLRVQDPGFSPGIGDDWQVTRSPDRSVATVDGGHLTHCNDSGCTGTLTFTVTAEHPGRTSVDFQYCYRSGPGPQCRSIGGGPPPGPVVITVTVP